MGKGKGSEGYGYEILYLKMKRPFEILMGIMSVTYIVAC
jgi:hypothetical protein